MTAGGRPSTFGEMAAVFEQLPLRVMERALSVGERYLVIFEDVAVGTDTYSDVTGANRASTMSFIATSDTFPGPVPEQSRATVSLFNPGYEADDNTLESPPPNCFVIDTMSGTTYSLYLNIRNGLESSYLLDAMMIGGSQVFTGLCAMLSEMFQGQ